MARCYYDDGYYNGDCHDGWYLYGRWILLGGILLAVLLGYLLFSFISARRRKRAGAKPFLGTGWTLGVTPPGHNPPTYNPPPGPPPPAYGAQREGDVELGEPKPAHVQ